MKVTLALVVLASIVASALAQPRFIRAGGVCADRLFRWPCPTYEYMPRWGIEFRHYNGPLGVVFATAFGPPGVLFDGADFTFRAVERYFNGSNRENRRFENTVPFMLVVETVSITEWAYSAFFFLPNGTVFPPPQPLEAYVRTGVLTNGFNLAVEQFAPTPIFEAGVDVAEQVIFGAAHGLEETLRRRQVPYGYDHFIFNEYNLPFIRQNRRNEVSFEINPRGVEGELVEGEFSKLLNTKNVPVSQRHYL